MYDTLRSSELTCVFHSLHADPSASSSFQSVWVRKGSLRWWRDWKPQRWVDVGVALEQSTKSDGRKDSIFFVYYTQYDEKKVGGAVMVQFIKATKRQSAYC